MDLNEKEIINNLSKKAYKLRYKMIEMMIKSKSGHPGGSLSCCEIITALYFYFLNINPENPNWNDRDRFILSKGHSAPILYVALSERGYFPEKELFGYRRYKSMLQGHPDMNKTPGIDMSTGTLGEGLSPLVGMAIVAKSENKNWRTYAILGDGEINEGQIWEAAMLAGNKKLDNIIIFIDYNKLQFDDYCCNLMDLEPLAEKWRSFKWEVSEINGNDMNEVFKAIKWAQKVKGRPVAIICNTVKGKGVSFMENSIEWHSIADQEKLNIALKELEGKL